MSLAAGNRVRAVSGGFGRSTLTTSAPSSERMRVASGPTQTWASSTTRSGSKNDSRIPLPRLRARTSGSPPEEARSPSEGSNSSSAPSAGAGSTRSGVADMRNGGPTETRSRGEAPKKRRSRRCSSASSSATEGAGQRAMPSALPRRTTSATVCASSQGRSSASNSLQRSIRSRWSAKRGSVASSGRSISSASATAGSPSKRGVNVTYPSAQASTSDG